MTLRYGSVCSGIEAASVAWHPLGFVPAFFSEIEKFPSRVLAHHYGSNMPGEPHAANGVPNYGDMTQFQEWPDAAIDVLVGGTPCQSFSIAGLRAGLDDPRGNLALTFLALAERYKPRWIVWENVPGVLSSNGGGDFAAFLGGLSGIGYGWAYRVLDAQFIRVDGHARAVPQRRRRVFVVGYSGGDWRRAAAVLFEPESMRGDSPPRREAGQGVAPTIAARTRGGGGPKPSGSAGVGQSATNFDCDGGLIASTGDVSHCLNAGGMGRIDYETETLIANPIAATIARGAESAGKGGYAGRRQEDDINLVAHALRAEGFDASEDGTGRGTPLVPIAFTTGQEPKASDEVAFTITQPSPTGGGQPQCVAFPEFMGGTAHAAAENLSPALGAKNPTAVAAPICFDETQITSVTNRSNPQPGDPCHTLAKGAVAPSIAFAIQERAVSENPDAGPDGIGVQADISYTLEARTQVQATAYSIMPMNSSTDYKARKTDVAQPLMVGGPAGGNQGGDYIVQQWAVRRLTPRECERLQGFPDDYTNIPGSRSSSAKRGSANKEASDGGRYKALGNSMAVNVMRWIGMRIQIADAAFNELDQKTVAA